MKRFLTAAMLTGAAACASGPQNYGPGPPAVVTGDAGSTFLHEHNVERAAAGVPPLAWDVLLASDAAAYARQLAALGTMRHSPRQSRPGQGENLWMGTRGAFAPQTMIRNWASEKRMFRPGIFPNVSTTGDWSAVGHYTQIIWPTTTRLGCGQASNGRADFLVCRYAPAGNIDGRRVP